MAENTRRKKENVVWDFVLLNPLTEETMMKTLCGRFLRDHIYTYIGNELIVVNPFKDLDIYTKEMALSYYHLLPFQLPPHVFSIISNAYHWLIHASEDGCIVLFGVSGSGKTEALDRILQFLSIVVSYLNFHSKLIGNDILCANIILEAFGNAETLQNSNSSRFCKFLDIEFDFKGNCLSANYTCYFLDKERITNRLFGERNFHIFYQILCGADVSLLKTLKLNRNILSYSILKQSKSIFNIEEDKQKFWVTKKSMRALNFSEELIINVFKIISATLKLGNLNFSSTTNIDGSEGCVISNEPEMYDICFLLGIDISTFKATSTCRSMYIFRQSKTTTVRTEMLAEEAAYARDGLCKALYSRLFIWLVKIINSEIKLEPKNRRQRLSFFDMFGFENLEKNGFHQFIINYCNEIVFHTVLEGYKQSEFEEYIREGVERSLADFDGSFRSWKCDEKISEELLVIFDQSRNDLRNEMLLQQKLSYLNLTSAPATKLSQFDQSHKTRCNHFKLRHYLGEVVYNIDNFASKNNDIVKRDVSIMMFGSTHPLLKDLFPEGSVEMSNLKKLPCPPSKQIKIALNDIIRNLTGRKLFYVRCIKPNNLKIPHILEKSLVLEQVRTQRIIETIRFKKNGFTYSLSHTQFLERYKMLSLKTWPSSRLSVIESIQYMLHDLPIPTAEFAFGQTKIFVRSPRSIYELEEYRRHRLNDIVVIIQSVWKSYIQRKKFLKMKRSQMIICAAWKLYTKMKVRKRINFNRQIDWAIKIIQKHYIEWKLYEFLKRVIRALNSRTMSPINQEWPSCPMRLAECSSLLRKLHHKWRCHIYRRQFNQTGRNKMREKVIASYLFKDKKCLYYQSVGEPFVGDYARIRHNSLWKNSCAENDRHVVFADVVNKIARATGKLIPSLLVVSTQSVLILDPCTLDTKYHIPASEIFCISLSPYEDNVAVIHIYSNEQNSSNIDLRHCFSSTTSAKIHPNCFFSNDYHEKGDIIFQTNHVIEVVTKLFLVVQNLMNKSPEVNISSTFNARFYQHTVSISFFHITSRGKMQSESTKILRKGNTMEICIVEH